MRSGLSRKDGGSGQPVIQPRPPFSMRKFQTDDSTTIKELHYNDDAKQMLAFFRNGGAYFYDNVTLAEFGKIISAESVGSAFSEFAKNKTSGYRRIR